MRKLPGILPTTVCLFPWDVPFTDPVIDGLRTCKRERVALASPKWAHARDSRAV
ncbi:MAG: hypothetical protein L5657_00635 [Calditerricola sp.]|nr:hypothetical protein [Calditerricola sp.]